MGVEYINPFGTKGALLYSPDGSMCVLRSRQPGHSTVRAVLRHFVPNKGLHPLRRLRVYPSALGPVKIYAQNYLQAPAE